MLGHHLLHMEREHEPTIMTSHAQNSLWRRFIFIHPKQTEFGELICKKNTGSNQGRCENSLKLSSETIS